MQNPEKEIANIALLITTAVNPEIQKACVMKYYASDVAFRHPLCAISPGPNSRDALLNVLSWYRIMSPVHVVHVNEVAFNKEKNIVFLDMSQQFHIRWSPFSPAMARIIVHLKLRAEPSPTDPSKTVYIIAEQEDFYHPEDIAALVIPPLIPLIRAGLYANTIGCGVLRRMFNMFGYWTIHEGESGKGVAANAPSEPLQPVINDETTREQGGPPGSSNGDIGRKGGEKDKQE